MTNNAKLHVIVDTGCANLSSVKFALERIGFNALITDDVAIIKSADKVILPGVGNAKHAMANIHQKNLKAKALKKVLILFVVEVQMYLNFLFQQMYIHCYLQFVH